MKVGTLRGIVMSACGCFLVAITAGSSPAPHSYVHADQSLGKARAELKSASTQPEVARVWEEKLTGLEADLAAFAKAVAVTDRAEIAGRLQRQSAEFAASPWAPAQAIAAEINTWLNPRLALIAAEDRLLKSIAALPPTDKPEVSEHRSGWVKFISEELDPALAAFESAPTVIKRAQARDRVEFLLDRLIDRLKSSPWNPGITVQGGLIELYRQSNVVVRADSATVFPLFATEVVTSGPVDFKGHRSYVTKGAYLGFALENRDDGIGFTNSQMLTSITPVNDFNQEMSQRDARAARATELYYFSATTRDDSQLTIHTLLSPAGLKIWPSYVHNVNASIDAAPTAGAGGKRIIASLVGMNRQRIVQKVYEGAIGPIRQNVDADAMELGSIRTSEAAAERNAQLAKFLPGDGSVRLGDYSLAQAGFRSRSNYVEAYGIAQTSPQSLHRGALAPAPASQQTVENGVVALVDLGAVLTNVIPHLIESKFGDVENFMLVIKPQSEADKGLTIKKNVAFEEYSKTLNELTEGASPSGIAIRVRVPKRKPEFTTDRRGNLSILVHDLDVEVPAPKSKGLLKSVLGPEARIYRITSPLAEFDLDFKLEPAGDGGLKVNAKVVDFDAGEKAKIAAIQYVEDEGKDLTSLSKSAILQGFQLALQAKPIDTTIARMTDRVTLREASKLDPSGWLRVVLTPAPDALRPAAKPEVAAGGEARATATAAPTQAGETVR